MSVTDLVRQEKKEYEKQVLEEFQETKAKLESEEKLVPVSQITQKKVVALMRDYYPPEVMEQLTISEANAEKLYGALRQMNKSILKASVPQICFKKDAQITIDDFTLKPIDRINIGDKVLTHKGNIKDVYNIIKNKYNGELLSFGLYKNKYFTTPCTPTHPFLVKRIIKGKKYSKVKGLEKCPYCEIEFKQKRIYPNHLLLANDSKHIKELKKYYKVTEEIFWAKAKDIQVGDFILSPAPNIESGNENNHDLAVLLGYYLAEGCVIDRRNSKWGNKGMEVIWTFNNNEIEYHREVQTSLLNLGFNCNFSEKKEHHVMNISSGLKIAEILKFLGGCYCNHKKINSLVFKWRKEDIKTLIRCYINGDGSWRSRKNKHECSYTTTSKDLSDQLFSLIKGLGLKINISSEYKPINKLTYYLTYLPINTSSNILQKELCNKNSLRYFYHHDKEGMWYKIKEVRKENYKGEVYNLEVKDDHSYCIDNFAVHNCKGPQCTLAEKCPLFKNKVAPIGHNCVLEMMLMDQWEKEYLDDLPIDSQSKVELDLVRELVEADIFDWRTSHEIAKHGLFDWNVIGISNDGKPITSKQEAIALGIKLKFKARKDRLREDLLATKKIKAKFGLNRQIDPSKYAANLNRKYQESKNEQVAEVVEFTPIVENK